MRIRWICGPMLCLGKQRTLGEEWDVDELAGQSLLNQGIAVLVEDRSKLAAAPKDEGKKLVAAPPKDKKDKDEEK